MLYNLIMGTLDLIWAIVSRALLLATATGIYLLI
jgi:hypothetical protein